MSSMHTYIHTYTHIHAYIRLYNYVTIRTNGGMAGGDVLEENVLDP